MIALDIVVVQDLMLKCIAPEDVPDEQVITIQGWIPDPDGDLVLYRLLPETVALKHSTIRELTIQMPLRAQSDLEHGGNMRVDQLNVDSQGEVWTTSPWNVEYLVVLALAAGVCEFALPRESWGDLPDGVAQVTFFRAPEGVTSLPAGTAVL